jgi:hypothetical protein
MPANVCEKASHIHYRATDAWRLVLSTVGQPRRAGVATLHGMALPARRSPNPRRLDSRGVAKLRLEIERRTTEARRLRELLKNVQVRVKQLQKELAQVRARRGLRPRVLKERGRVRRRS